MDMLLYAILNKKIKNSGSGGGTVDLSGYATKEEVAQAIEYAHTHQNKTTLNKIFINYKIIFNQIGATKKH